MAVTRTARLVGIFVLLLAVAHPIHARDSNKWRIQCSEGADSSGEIAFRFELGDATGFEVVVPIPDGTSENHVARTIRDAFKAQLDSTKFHVEVDDGEDVLVKAKRGQADFTITVTRNTVKSVRISLDRE